MEKVSFKEYFKEQLGFDPITPTLKSLGARNPGFINLVGALKYKVFCEEFNSSKEDNKSTMTEGLNLQREA